MRVLHINDLAGVAGCLTKYLRKAGHQADWISFMDDAFGFIPFYGGRHFHNQEIFRHILAGMVKEYDILHLHFSFRMLDWLYQFNKPIVMHYHGSELAMNRDARVLDYKCKAVLVAGEQLLDYHPRAQYLPTIVDTEHFRDFDLIKEGEYMTFSVPYLKPIQIPDSELTTYARGRAYREMPILLNRYEGYIDVRHHKDRGLLTDMSKTALEALACGLKVYCNDKWITELPEQHKPEKVVSQLVKIYEGIVND